jgi:pyridoxamine 5'-phosphate oxidase
MDFKDCVKFANEQRIAYLATDDKGQPRVRPLGMWFADETGFYFQAWYTKAVCKQLQINGKVELCFYGPGPDGSPGKVLRAAGEVEFLDDPVLKAKVLEDRPFLKNMGIETPDDPRLAIFRIHKGEAFFWSMEFSGRESEIERIKF